MANDHGYDKKESLFDRVVGVLKKRLALWEKKGGSHRIEGTPLGSITVESEIILLVNDMNSMRGAITELEKDSERFSTLASALMYNDSHAEFFITCMEKHLGDMLAVGASASLALFREAVDYAIVCSKRGVIDGQAGSKASEPD